MSGGAAEQSQDLGHSRMPLCYYTSSDLHSSNVFTKSALADRLIQDSADRARIQQN